MSYHTILVAVCIEAESRQEAEEELHQLLPDPSSEDNGVDCWWIAEDERYDRSDNDSAVFCGVGNQRKARSLIEAAGLE